MEIRTTEEIINNRDLSPNWAKPEDRLSREKKKWVAVDDIIKLLDRLDRSQGWEIKMVIENTLSKSTEQKSSKSNNNYTQ